MPFSVEFLIIRLRQKGNYCSDYWYHITRDRDNNARNRNDNEDPGIGHGREGVGKWNVKQWNSMS